MYFIQSITFKKLLGHLIYSYLLAAWKYNSCSSHKRMRYCSYFCKKSLANVLQTVINFLMFKICCINEMTNCYYQQFTWKVSPFILAHTFSQTTKVGASRASLIYCDCKSTIIPHMLIFYGRGHWSCAKIQ